MRDLGVRLRLLFGENELKPAPFAVVDALDSLEVRNNDRERDGFQMTFRLGRPHNRWDYPLLQETVLDPPHRVSIVVIIQGRPEVLINGIITQHQVIPSNEPGQSRLQVTGEDTGLLLDLTDHVTVHHDCSDSDIVRNILGKYDHFRAEVKRTTDTHAGVPQRETDRALIERLARRNSFFFFTEPTADPGESLAYWGPRDRKGLSAQPALSMNMGWLTNVTQLTFNYDALRPVRPQVTIIDPRTKQSVPIPEPSPQPAPLARRPAQALRSRALPHTSGLTHRGATRRAQAAADEGAEAVSASGEVDVVHYQGVLRSRRTVGVRGAGGVYDGTYYVKQVTHRIQRGEYKQSFSLTRGGRQASEDKVAVTS
jgi:hypothetical protein